MPNVVSVVFNDGGKVYHFDAGELELAPGDRVVVETQRGTDFGRVVGGMGEATADASRGLKRVVRVATAADEERARSNTAVVADALAACRELVADMGLAMKVVSAESTFDGGRLTVSYFSEDRVDTRDLASRLNDRVRRRIELRPVTARDEARLVGGYGPCGRRLCCSLFAGNQEPVSIRMAKDQNLPLNPSKISGGCGRLMCCLKYEHKVYVDFRQRAPKKGAYVTTPSGKGKVVELLAPTDSVAVDLGEGRVGTWKLSELLDGDDREDA